MAAAETASTGLRDRPLSREELPTTDGALFLGNFDARIRSLKARLKASGPVLVSCGTLASDLRTRGQYSENLPDFLEVEKLLDDCFKAGVRDKEIYLLRSVASLALHKFQKAGVDLRTAFDAGIDEGLYQFMRQALLWEQGKYAEAREIAVRAATVPSVSTLTRMGTILFQEGKYGEGHRFFVDAEDRMTEPNPLLLAWIYTQRGRAYVSAGDTDLAKTFCAAALERMPDYKMATECLAEAHAGAGEIDEAIATFKKLVAAVPPDLKATLKLTALYEWQDTLASRTKAKGLMAVLAPELAFLQAKVPEIFYGINAEVLIASGLTSAARPLLGKAIEVHGLNSGMLQLRAKLNLKGGDLAAARADVEAALQMNPKSSGLHLLAAEVFAAAGEAGLAEDQRKSAAALNPKIFDEGRLWF